MKRMLEFKRPEGWEESDEEVCPFGGEVGTPFSYD
jgi:hypothetical protein